MYLLEELTETVNDDSAEKRALPEQVYVPVQIVVGYEYWRKLSRSEAEVIKVS